MSWLPWHKGVVRAFEGCGTEVVHPSFQTKGMYFKAEGASSTFYPARVNANLVKIWFGPLKEKHMISLTHKDTEVAETFARESSALHSHLLGLTDLLMALNSKMEDPSTRPTIQPIISQVLEHHYLTGTWEQALLSNSCAFDI